MIGGGWKEGIILSVHTSRLHLMSLELFDTQRGTLAPATSCLSPVHSHHHHQSQQRLTLLWLADFMFELTQKQSYWVTPSDTCRTDDFEFVPGDSRSIGWHFARPIGVIPFWPLFVLMLCGGVVLLEDGCKITWLTASLYCGISVIQCVHCFVPVGLKNGLIRCRKSWSPWQTRPQPGRASLRY